MGHCYSAQLLWQAWLSRYTGSPQGPRASGFQVGFCHGISGKPGSPKQQASIPPKPPERTGNYAPKQPRITGHYTPKVAPNWDKVAPNSNHRALVFKVSDPRWCICPSRAAHRQRWPSLLPIVPRRVRSTMPPSSHSRTCAHVRERLHGGGVQNVLEPLLQRTNLRRH